MRGLVDVPMPYPIAGFLPAPLQEDDLLVRWTQGLDEVWAPVVSTLDCLDAYLDPWLTPADFLGWLGAWVGAHLDEHWPLDRQREMVAGAAAAHRLRGTVAGLRLVLELATGGQVEIADSAGVTWSASPVPPLPAPAAHVQVRVRVADPARTAVHPLEVLARAVVPAHVTTTVEVLGLDHLS